MSDVRFGNVHGGKMADHTVDSFVEALVEDDSFIGDLQIGIQLRSCGAGDASDLISGRIAFGRSIDANDLAAFAFSDSSYHETRVRRPCHATDNQSIEEDTELLLLLGELNNKVGETKTSEFVVTRSGRNVIRFATLLSNIVHSLLCRSLVADVEWLIVKSDIAAHQAGQQNVAGLVVKRRVNGDPFLLHSDCLETRSGRCSSDSTCVITLYASNGDQSIASFGDGVRNEIL